MKSFTRLTINIALIWQRQKLLEHSDPLCLLLMINYFPPKQISNNLSFYKEPISKQSNKSDIVITITLYCQNCYSYIKSLFLICFIWNYLFTRFAWREGVVSVAYWCDVEVPTKWPSVCSCYYLIWLPRWRATRLQNCVCVRFERNVSTNCGLGKRGDDLYSSLVIANEESCLE